MEEYEYKLVNVSSDFGPALTAFRQTIGLRTDVVASSLRLPEIEYMHLELYDGTHSVKKIHLDDDSISEPVEQPTNGFVERLKAFVEVFRFTRGMTEISERLLCATENTTFVPPLTRLTGPVEVFNLHPKMSENEEKMQFTRPDWCGWTYCPLSNEICCKDPYYYFRIPNSQTKQLDQIKHVAKKISFSGEQIRGLIHALSDLTHWERDGLIPFDSVKAFAARVGQPLHVIDSQNPMFVD